MSVGIKPARGPLMPMSNSARRWPMRDCMAAVRAAFEAGRLVMGPLASFLVHRLTAERALVADPATLVTVTE